MKDIKKSSICVLAVVVTVLAQLPAEPTDLITITTPQGINIRYKEPGICETTHGVKSYSGFIDVDDDNHLFFWFFESRRGPARDPITLWLNGGPGADMTTGLFEELGPCFLNEDLSTRLNPHSWNEISNMLFLSQPTGVGFSYGSKTTDPLEQFMMGGMTDLLEGRFATADWLKINSTESAAQTAWIALQAFHAALPQLSPNITSKTFNLATESYGGHWGSVFMSHFHTQNELLLANPPSAGATHLSLNSLIVINGLIDTRTQSPSYPRFARSNTHGITVNSTVSSFMDFSLHNSPHGCLAMIDTCALYWSLDNGTTSTSRLACAEASTVCRRGVELPYAAYSGIEDIYDVRNKTLFPNPPPVTARYLNQAHVQEALGVDTNYTNKVNTHVLASFWNTGDFVNPKNMRAFERLLDHVPVRVSLWYGDADYLCTWYGGEDLSLAVNFSGAETFREAGYAPLIIDGERGGYKGDVRESGNFSFTRVFDAGHMVPWWQPEVGLELFNRSVNGWDLAEGKVRVGERYVTVGERESTFTQEGERERGRRAFGRFRREG